MLEGAIDRTFIFLARYLEKPEVSSAEGFIPELLHLRARQPDPSPLWQPDEGL
jgi:hypothetical protein